jgi:hypothetical protein
VAYLEQLLKADLTETKRKSSLGSITIKEFSKDMFTEGAPHLARWAAKGKVLKRQTVIQHRRHLTGYLLPKFENQHLTRLLLQPLKIFYWSSGFLTRAEIPYYTLSSW